MYEYRVDVNTISMVLGNTPRTVMNQHIITLNRKYDACDMVDCAWMVILLKQTTCISIELI